MVEQQHMNDGSGAAPPAPPAPPTFPGARPVVPPVWPAVLGVIGIVYAAGGFLASVFQALAIALFSAIEDLLPPNAAAQHVTSLDDRRLVALSVALYIFLCGAAVLLLIGSIGLLRHRPLSAKLLRIWAISRIVLAAADSAISYYIGLAVLEAARPTPLPMSWSLVFGAVFEWLLYSAFPVFMLIWLFLAGPRRDIQRWRAGESA